MGTGKRPVLDGLGLDYAGVAPEGGVIRADARCRTSVPHTFAIGDVTGGLMLAHTAAQQGRAAAATIVGEDMTHDQARDCGVNFTRPAAAFVGCRWIRPGRGVSTPWRSRRRSASMPRP
jgi:dihydrolipoamide dehydrogenase